MSGGRWNTNHVPAENGLGNNTINDVIGNKNDGHTGNSLYSKAEIVDDHFHSSSMVYPTLADGVTVASGAGAWNLGSFVEIVPVGAITSDFDIHFISLEDIGANGVYEIVLYAVTTPIGSARFARTTLLSPTLNVPVQTPIIAANTQIQAKIANAAVASEDVDLSLFYHTY